MMHIRWDSALIPSFLASSYYQQVSFALRFYIGYWRLLFYIKGCDLHHHGKIVCVYIEVCAALCRPRVSSLDYPTPRPSYVHVLSFLQESKKIVNVCVRCRLDVSVLFSKCRGSEQWYGAKYGALPKPGSTEFQ